MGLLSKLFGEKQKHDPIRPDLQFYEKVINSIAVSEEFQIGLKTTIKLAFENSKSFYNNSGNFILSDRGLTYKKDNGLTPKFVLVDKMISAGQMTEVDWKEEEDEIRFSIIEIAKAKGYDLPLSYDNKYTKNTFEILCSINDNELEPLGYCLEILDINSDSYVFTIIPLNKKQLVKSLFDKLK